MLRGRIFRELLPGSYLRYTALINTKPSSYVVLLISKAEQILNFTRHL